MPIILLFPILLMTKGSLLSARAQAPRGGSPLAGSSLTRSDNTGSTEHAHGDGTDTEPEMRLWFDP